MRQGHSTGRRGSLFLPVVHRARISTRGQRIQLQEHVIKFACVVFQDVLHFVRIVEPMHTSLLFHLGLVNGRAALGRDARSLGVGTELATSDEDDFRRFNMSILSPSQQSWFRIIAEGSGTPTDFSGFGASASVGASTRTISQHFH